MTKKIKGALVYMGSSIVDCGSTGEGSTPSRPSVYVKGRGY